MISADYPKEVDLSQLIKDTDALSVIIRNKSASNMAREAFQNLQRVLVGSILIPSMIVLWALPVVVSFSFAFMANDPGLMPGVTGSFGDPTTE